ncbi:MAG TPA: hypothetical protein VIO81_08835, partial [Methyloversatilis sp.]
MRQHHAVERNRAEAFGALEIAFLAKFVDILRSKNDDIAVLADDIIRSLVRYMNANQGALYIVNDD